jgi:hypothetical protein
MERLATMIDDMIDMEVINQKNEIISIIDMDISLLFSNLKYDIQPTDDNLEFQCDLKKVVFKYRERLVNISYNRKYLNYGSMYKYKVLVS